MNPRLAVIDDDFSFLEIFAELLEEQLPHWNIIRFQSSVEAIARLVDFEVIITDYRMPIINGKEIIDKALGLGKQRIYLISGEFPEEIQHQYKNKIQLISKPINGERLRKLIAELQ